MKTKFLRGLGALGAMILLADHAAGQSTAFTYQGRLSDGSGPATGPYHLQFTLFDAVTDGGVVAGPLTNALTAVNHSWLKNSLITAHSAIQILVIIISGSLAVNL